MKKRKKMILIIGIIILAIIITIIVKVKNNKNSNLQENEENHPVIYYSFDEESKMPLLDNNSAFANSPKITWSYDCSGTIKKDGQEFSSQSGVLLAEEGNYEITVKSNTGNEKVIKNLTIDKTPPEVEIKENSSGTYTINFADVNDIEMATLTKLDPKTKKLESEKDLTEGGLQKSIEIKEKGYYILKVSDKLGNLISGKTKFSIK